MAWIRIEQVYAGKEINKPPQTIYLNEEHIVSIKPYKVGKTMEGYFKQDLFQIKMNMFYLIKSNYRVYKRF